MGASALELEGVVRRFGGVAAVSDVSLSIAAGARHAVIGPNGAGKTTLFNVVSGDLRANAGHIKLLGHDVTHSSASHRATLGLGRTYQVARAFASLTVRENLALGAFRIPGVRFWTLREWRSRRGVASTVEEAAANFRLDGRLDERVSSLSHGERRELEIAIALCAQPKVLLLDEPAAGLSAHERRAVAALLSRLPADLTLVLIEHDLDFVRDVADSVSVLHRGALVTQGDVATVQRNELVREIYLGGVA